MVVEREYADFLASYLLELKTHIFKIYSHSRRNKVSGYFDKAAQVIECVGWAVTILAAKREPNKSG